MIYDDSEFEQLFSFQPTPQRMCNLEKVLAANTHSREIISRPQNYCYHYVTKGKVNL